MLNQAINFPIQSLASEITGSALIDIEREVLREAGVSYSEYYNTLLTMNKKYLTNERLYEIITPWEWELPINEVHDDIVVDFPPHRVEKGTELVIETMRAVPTLRSLWPDFGVPLNVEPKTGVRWGLTQ